MNTFLGISDKLTVSEVDEEALRNSPLRLHRRIPEFVRNGAHRRDALPRTGGSRRHQDGDDAIRREHGPHLSRRVDAMLGNGVDHLFCNEEEALDWAGSDRLDIAVAELKDIARSVNVTLGARGSLVIDGHDRWEVPGFPVKPIDTNGAGDIYAGACLAGWTAGMPPQVAARFGNFAAARLITRYGARLETMADYRAVLRRLPQRFRPDRLYRHTGIGSASVSARGLTRVRYATTSTPARCALRTASPYAGSMSSAVVTRSTPLCCTQKNSTARCPASRMRCSSTT